MRQYLDYIDHILVNGTENEDRTGVGVISTFGYQMRFNLQDGFPIVTTKNVNFDSVSSELMWFLEGSTDERRLAELRYKKPRSELVNKRTIWTDNANKQGVDLGFRNDDEVKELGGVYSKQWRNWEGVDQIKVVLDQIKNDPNSRRMIVSSWNTGDLDKMALPPCHTMFQFYVSNGKLSCQMYQRSSDVFLGAPYNIASYSLLTHIFAREAGLDVGDFVYSIGNAHIYKNHIEQIKEQLKRKPHKLPVLQISNNFKLSLDSPFPMDVIDNFSLINYKSHEILRGKMAV